MWHLTARMAWHDRGWDGHVCNNPAANTYCTGTHSLLSDRLAREKRVALEESGAKLDGKMPAYLPPCFWSSCAFSDSATQTVHKHPFQKLKNSKQITGVLPPYSAYTWPFRLSITHASYERHGQYFPDLERRIERYCNRLQTGRSLVFFYLNYDNPVSADDYRYALVGCARLADIQTAGSYAFDPAELAEQRAGDGMQNFPTLNWALQLTHKGPSASVRLPYQQYLAHLADHPEDEAKLEEIRVLIEEPALLPGFKYVSEQVNDDHALALLYKLKRAFGAVEKHGIVKLSRELDILDELIEDLWQARGLYPGLGAVISVLADLAEGEPRHENLAGQELVAAIRAHRGDDSLLDATFSLLEETGAPPAEFAAFKRTIRNARAGLKDHKGLLPTLRKLSLFALTTRQVARILFPDREKLHAFGGQDITANEIAANPYLLSEAYVPATDDDAEERSDLDREQRTDGPIDYFTIDLGMFPDQNFVEPDDDLQDLTVAGPERLRAFAIEALGHNEALGHSFAPLTVLVEEARNHPLIHRDSIALTEAQFLSEDHLNHFAERLYIKQHDGAYYFYIQETKHAEDIVNRFVSERLALSDHKVDVSWLEAYLEAQATALSSKIGGFDVESFKAERGEMMRGALQRALYCVTGRPGSGKTQALRTVLDKLQEAGESAIVLAPTGKAALRLNSESLPGTLWKAETIDRWIFSSGLSDYLDGKPLSKMVKSARYVNTDNIVVDEMSMVDLHHLALLFRAIEIHQPGSVKRVILVGDENQLPPIGCGRPFFDIISFLREDAARDKQNIARLTTNCRQQHDPVVLDAAHLFAGKNRYHTELWEKLLSGGPVSEYLHVEYWEGIAQLQDLVGAYYERIISEALPDREGLTGEQTFNLLLGLYDKGFVPNNDAKALNLDRAQILTPYRGGPSGALGLSDFVRSVYRHESWPDKTGLDSGFAHSDKIIRISNLYLWNKESKRKELCLSNGSIGVVCNNRKGRQAFFAETKYPLWWQRLKEEDFELAYSITVHKAQGSEFQEVLVVLPERRALLSRELVYTALTRSKTKLHILVQKTARTNPLQVARDRSVLLLRNSSIFAEPFDSSRMFEPEQGVRVRSKIEYLIYRALQEAREAGKLTFSYEEHLELPIEGRIVKVRPDFTIRCAGKTFYWEHLGMLDRADYSRDWRSRRNGYDELGLTDVLLTTDDLAGVRQEKLRRIIDNIVAGKLSGAGESAFSAHHYTL